jgi:hypothetical protein
VGARAACSNTHHFRDPENVPEPRGCEIVVVILWSRLGVMLSADKCRGAVCCGWRGLDEDGSCRCGGETERSVTMY